MPHRDHEVEIKLAVANAAAARRLLRGAGFQVARRRLFERNILFDTAAGTLRTAHCLLRVREAAGEVKLTFKGPPEPGPHKSREELETEVASARVFVAVLERLGFGPVFRYEKYRTEFRQAGRGGIATVDETPIGVYVELEGSPAWIDRTARKLGFAPDRYITASYGSLYLDWCRERGIEPSDMIFQ